MSLTLKHAKRELALLGYKMPDEYEDENDPNKWACANILELLDVFAKQGHSGMSAPYVIGMFFKLANHEPITPLTGDDSEWEKVDYQTLQNVRCSRVFKNINTNEIYDIQGKVFEEPDGARYTSKESRVAVTFPYMPHTEVIKVPKEPEFENVDPSTVQ
jgi:hypothetical protein